MRSLSRRSEAGGGGLRQRLGRSQSDVMDRGPDEEAGVLTKARTGTSVSSVPRP